MARKKTIVSAVNDAVKSQMGWAKWYRGYAAKIRQIGKELPKDLPCENLVVETSALTYSPPTSEDAAKIRAKVGQILGVSSWEKTVNPYSGNINYRGKSKLPSGHEMTIVIEKAELAPGCKVIQVEETRKVWKSVCPDAEGNTQLELTS